MKLLQVAASVVFLAGIGLFSVSPQADAATLHVRPDGTGEYPTIRATILSAQPGDSVALEDGWYHGPDNHNLDFGGKQLTLLSQSGNPLQCVIDSWTAEPVEERAFTFQSGEDAGSLVTGVGMVNGYTHGNYCHTGGAGVLVLQDSSPTFRNCAFKYNDGVVGGAVATLDSAGPVFYDCLFVQNRVSNSGGAVWVGNNTNPQFIRCRFSGNQVAADAGAVETWNGSHAVFQECLFEDHDSAELGGVVGVNGSEVVFSQCLFRGNRAFQGGVFHVNPHAMLSVNQCTFTGNYAEWCGVADIQGTGRFSGCSLVGNGAGRLGIIDGNGDGFVSIDHTVIAFSSSGSAAHCFGLFSATLDCCDLYANPGGDWRWCIEDQYNGDTNMSVDPLFCDPENGDFHLMPGSPLLQENSPCGQIGAWGAGCETGFVGESPLASASFRVRVTPNPSPRACRIEWEGSENRSASLEIFDVAGHRVRSIRDLPPGLTAASWNGLNDRGQPVSSGIYLIRVQATGSGGLAGSTGSAQVTGTTRVVLTR